jgi:hypothetical protein
MNFILNFHFKIQTDYKKSQTMQKIKIELSNFADDPKNNLELIKCYAEELYRMAGRPLPAESLRKN